MKTQHLLLSMVIIMILASCRSVEKMIDTGNFDSAVVKSAKKLKGKKKLKTKYVIALEEAFAKATNRDIGSAKSLSESLRSEDLKRVLGVYERIARRQRTVDALLPIVSKDGYQARFKFVKVEGLATMAEERYVELLKQEALSLLQDARAGDKVSARAAHLRFERIQDYRAAVPEIKKLSREAEELGMVTVRVGVENFTRHLISRSLEQQLIGQGLPDSRWLRYTNARSQAADFEVIVVLDAVEVSPERVREQVAVRKKEIEDGFEYVLDQNGNVMKDTSGNDIQVPRYREIKARVISIEQFKSALLAGEVICRNLKTDVSDHLPIQSEIVFDHVSADFKGDRRALLKKDKNRIATGYVPFPSDEAMFADAIARISPMIRQKIGENTFL